MNCFESTSIKNKNGTDPVYDERRLINVIKAFSVILIVMAHSCSVIDTDIGVSRFVLYFEKFVATGGVVIFFICSGYLLKYNKRTIGNFLLNKLITIIIPWLFTGTLVYLYVYLRKGGLGVLSWVKYVLGYGTYLWFLPILLVMQIIYLFLGKYKIFHFIAIGVSLVSFIVNNFIFYYTIPGFEHFNLPNWLLFFSLGYVINEYRVLDKVIKWCKLLLPLSVIVVMGLCVLCYTTGMSVQYESMIYVPVSLFIAAVGFGIGMLLLNSKLMNYLGAVSFSIYLVHMPFAGILLNLTRRVSPWLVIFSPVVCVAITATVIFIYQIVIRAIKLEKWGSILIGLRMPKQTKMEEKDAESAR